VVHERRETDALELGGELRRAGDGAGVQQRLVLPRPRFVVLIVLESPDVGDEKPTLPARP
jgi:hypothetical protein